MPSGARWSIAGALTLIVSVGGLAFAQEAAQPQDAAETAATSNGAAVSRATESAPAAHANDPLVQQIEAHYAKGRALYQAGRFDEAKAEFAAALKLRQTAATAASTIPTSTAAPATTSAQSPPPPPTVASIAPPSTSQASVTATSAAMVNSHLQALYTSGRTLYEAGRFEEARAAFEEALRVRQGNAAAQPVTVHVDIDQPVPESLQTQTWLKQVQKQHQQALRQQAVLHGTIEELRRKIISLRERVQRLPKDSKRYLKLTASLAQAEQAFVQRQAELAPIAANLSTFTKREATLWYNWGVEADQQGDERNAMDRYRQAIALNPDDASAHYNVAADLLKRRRFREAAAGYRRVLALNPQDADAHYNLGVIAEQHDGASKEAVEHYRAYLTLAPEEAPDRRIVQGWLNVLEGRRKEVDAE